MKRTENRLFLGLMLGLFVLGLFMQSCSSNASSPLSSNDDLSPLVKATSNNDLIVPDFSLNGFNNSDLLLDPPGGGGKDSSGKGGKDPRDTSNKGGNEKGGVRLRPLPIPCLDLDSAQMSQVRQFMADAALESKAANEAYRQAMEPIRASDNAAKTAYREATSGIQKALAEIQKAYREEARGIMTKVREGSMTREEAKTALQDLRTRFEAATKELRAQMETAAKALKAALSANDAARKAANDAYQTSLKRIQSMLNEKIAGILTPAQMLKWKIYLAGGDPCKTTGGGPKK